MIVDETLEDNLYAISAAKAAAAALNAKTEGDFDPIHWRDILPLVLPAGATMSLQDPGLVEAQTAKKEPEATNGEV